MNETMLLQVYVVPVEDNFVHLPSKLIRALNSRANRQPPVCLKVTSMDGASKEFYASYSQTPYNANGDDAFNISYELMSAVGLVRSQSVLVAVFDGVYPLERVHVTPVSNDDWDLLTLNDVSLQENILQQLVVVHKNQTFPIWVSKFIHLKIFIDYLSNNVQVGILHNSTEIIVNPCAMNSAKIINDKNTAVNENLNNNMITDGINHDDCKPITNNRFIFRTVLVKQTLLESNYIYDYCALISKSHMFLLTENDDQYSSQKMFVKISLLHKLDKIHSSQTKDKVNDPSVIINLCPLDKCMSNIDKIENITWPTIYVTKTIGKMLGLTMNSKVVLELINQDDNNVCDIQSIYISPVKEMKNVSQKTLTECTVKRLKEELDLRGVLVLNNSSLLRVFYKKILSLNVCVTFSVKSIPYIFLNKCNFGIPKFISQTEQMNVTNFTNLTDPTEMVQNDDSSNLMYYDLKCFKEMIKNGSSCLKLGLKCDSHLPQSFFAFDNLLITGPIGSGKTSTAKFFCQKFSKCPYFVKVTWINGRFLAGKIWETTQKHLDNHFKECLYYQPAIIVIDDFDDLCHLNSQPNDHSDMSNIFLRPLNLLMKMIENYTSNACNIRVICTAKPLSQKHEILFSKQFKNVFKTVTTVPIIDKENKKLIISKRLNKIEFGDDVDDTFLTDLCKKMDSYVIQDLIDYCDKVLFEMFKDESNKKLSKTILTDAYQKNVPMSLHDAKLFKEKKLNFSFVGGLNNAKQTLIETIIWPSVHSDVFSKCPLKLQSGVLLYGAPGTGKTLLAKAIVGESNLNFISVNGPELLSKYVGQSEESVRNLFQRAQNAKPCIVFVDEFESIAPRRGSDQTGVTDRVVNQFLTQLDGVDSVEGVWVVVATSRPDLIDKALLRPGRIGVKLHCSMPTVSDREDILKVLCKQVSIAEDVDLHHVAVETNNYSGADLNGMILSAYLIAEKKLEQTDSLLASDENVGQPMIRITADDFQEAIKTTKPSLSQTDIDRYEQIHQVFSGKKLRDNSAGANERGQKKKLLQMVSWA